MINTALPAPNSVYGREKRFFNNLLHQTLSGTVVQWLRSCLQLHMNQVLPLQSKQFFVSQFVHFFSVNSFCFNLVFSFGLFPLTAYSLQLCEFFCDNWW